MKPIPIRQSRYRDTRIEQDHRAIEWRIQPMLSCQSMASAIVILSAIESVNMVRNSPVNHACNRQPSRAEQFDLLAP
jgi:transposase-like protein